MTKDESYPNAPIILATMEIRHPATDPLTEPQSRELKRLLTDQLPIERQAQEASRVPGAASAGTGERFALYLNRESTVAASMKSQTIVVETSAYTGFQALCEIGMRVIEARTQISPIIGMERIGLRFVNEVRVPADSGGTIDWSDWMPEQLLGLHRTAPTGLSQTEWQGVSVYREPQPGRSLILRYGPGNGFAVDPNYHLRRVRNAVAGPFFFMDIDSFWTPFGSIPEYDRETLLATYKDLHRPAHSLFEDLITGRLRDELLRSAG